MYEVSKCAPQEALRNLDRAFDNFFRRLKLKKAGQFTGKLGFPKFKSKKWGLGSFRLTGAIHVFPLSIQLPRLGRLRLKEHGYLPVQAKINSATVSERAGRWFVSVQVEEEVFLKKAQGSPACSVQRGVSAYGLTSFSVRETTPSSALTRRLPLGVDLGVKKMAVCSDGTEIENPKALSITLRKLRRVQRELSRRKKGGKNREKSRRKIARLHYRITNIRKDAIEKATSSIVAKTKPVEQRPSVVVIEDLFVSGMLKNHKLARAISDVGFFEFRRQLTYKTAWNSVFLLVADRFFPSSKLCSACGAINDKLTLQDREWTCSCGAHHDRDRNAAINLSHYSPVQNTG
jgi:putative transposase